MARPLDSRGSSRPAFQSSMEIEKRLVIDTSKVVQSSQSTKIQEMSRRIRLWWSCGLVWPSLTSYILDIESRFWTKTLQNNTNVTKRMKTCMKKTCYWFHGLNVNVCKWLIGALKHDIWLDKMTTRQAQSFLNIWTGPMFLKYGRPGPAYIKNSRHRKCL